MSLFPQKYRGCKKSHAAVSKSYNALLLVLMGHLGSKVHSNMCVCVLSCSVVSWLFATPWTVAYQAALSVGILQAGILECVACPPPGNLPNPGVKPRSPTLQVDSLPSETPGKLRDVETLASRVWSLDWNSVLSFCLARSVFSHNLLKLCQNKWSKREMKGKTSNSNWRLQHLTSMSCTQVGKISTWK